MISEDIKDRIIGLRARGSSHAEIAMAVGVTRASVAGVDRICRCS